MLDLQVEPGGEKFIKWAKSKLSHLRTLRDDINMPSMTKSFVVDGSRITINSSIYGDRIRITGAAAGFWAFSELPYTTTQGASETTTTTDTETRVYETVFINGNVIITTEFYQWLSIRGVGPVMSMSVTNGVYRRHGIQPEWYSAHTGGQMPAPNDAPFQLFSGGYTRTSIVDPIVVFGAWSDTGIDKDVDAITLLQNGTFPPEWTSYIDPNPNIIFTIPNPFVSESFITDFTGGERVSIYLLSTIQSGEDWGIFGIQSDPAGADDDLNAQQINVVGAAHTVYNADTQELEVTGWSDINRLCNVIDLFTKEQIVALEPANFVGVDITLYTKVELASLLSPEVYQANLFLIDKNVLIKYPTPHNETGAEQATLQAAALADSPTNLFYRTVNLYRGIALS
jgi:hypothetical protein